MFHQERRIGREGILFLFQREEFKQSALSMRGKEKRDNTKKEPCFRRKIQGKREAKLGGNVSSPSHKGRAMGRLFSLKGTAGPDGCNIAHVRELMCGVCVRVYRYAPT